MPIPKPRPSEQRDDYIGRCMGDDTMIQDFSSQAQRFAVCLSTWNRREKSENNDNASRKP